MDTWISVIILLAVIYGAISAVGALNRIANSTERSEELLETLVDLARADAPRGETRD